MSKMPPTPDYSLPSTLPRAALEQMIIERTIADANFRQQLIENPVDALAAFFGTPLPAGLNVHVFVEDANTFYYVSPNTDPSVGAFKTEVGTAPPTVSARGSFIARLNYLLSDTDADPEDLDSLAQALVAADANAETAIETTRQAEVRALQAAQAAEDAETAYVAAVAAAALLPDNTSLTQVVAAADTARQTAQQAAKSTAKDASEARNKVGPLDAAATQADEDYEAALRAAFQKAFAVDAVAALNQFLNLETPFTAFKTITDTDPAPPAPTPATGITFTHLVETSGQVLFIVLPYTANRSLLMGPYSIRFDGSSSYIHVPRSLSLTAHALLTVEVWAWVDVFREGYQDVLLSTLTGGGGWQFEVGGGIPKFSMTLAGAAQVVTPGDRHLTLETGKWHYLVGIFQGENFLLYVNGYQWGQTTITGEITPGGDLLMGRNAAMQADPSFFQGMIHEVRLWGDAITADVIAGNIPASQDLKNIPAPWQEALIAHYVFDEGANFTALNDSPNHNDGAMLNAVWQITGLASPA